MDNKVSKLTIFWSTLALMGLMVVTRGHANPLNIVHLPDFTLAALFIAGTYLRNWIVPLVIIAFAMSIDWYVISNKGVSDFCITQAYMMLVPAYLVMFAGGLMFKSLAIQNALKLMKLTVVMAVSGALEWLISSASFYWMAPYFTDPTVAGFLPRIVKYAPNAMANLALLMIATVLAFTLFERYRGARRVSSHTESTASS